MRPALVEIDLGAIRHNLARARSTGCAIAAVVKANAYGHGIARVVPALGEAEKLAVASLEEAIALRDAGAVQPIMLLEGVFAVDELVAASGCGCELVIHGPDQVRMLETTRLDVPVALWLKVDSGMHRLGVAPAQAAAMHAELVGLPWVRRVGLMTHLATADEADGGACREQIERFTDAVAGLHGPRTIANTAAHLRLPEARGELARPGIMLWGASPFAGTTGGELGLRPAMTLKTALIAVRHVPAGQPVGYGAAWRAPADTVIGIAAIGYGDGYPRHAPSGTPVLVSARRCGLAGRVSMDMIAIDLGAEATDQVGDPVILWGEGLPVERVAAAAGTIAYELLCGVTARVRTAVVDDGVVQPQR